jgi:hypothetical protein
LDPAMAAWAIEHGPRAERRAETGSQGETEKPTA